MNSGESNMEGFKYQDNLLHSQDDKLKLIADRYGLFHQLGKLSEECSELSIECIKSINIGKVTREIVQEIADVEIMIAQIKYLAGLDEALIEGAKTYKINRQLMRIQKEDNYVQMS